VNYAPFHRHWARSDKVRKGGTRKGPNLRWSGSSRSSSLATVSEFVVQVLINGYHRYVCSGFQIRSNRCRLVWKEYRVINHLQASNQGNVISIPSNRLECAPGWFTTRERDAFLSNCGWVEDCRVQHRVNDVDARRCSESYAEAKLDIVIVHGAQHEFSVCPNWRRVPCNQVVRLRLRAPHKCSTRRATSRMNRWLNFGSCSLSDRWFQK